MGYSEVKITRENQSISANFTRMANYKYRHDQSAYCIAGKFGGVFNDLAVQEKIAKLNSANIKPHPVPQPAGHSGMRAHNSSTVPV